MDELAGRMGVPLCGREEFDALVGGLVADCAPKVFAVVQEYGDRVDGRIAGWGMAFEEHAEVVSVNGGFRGRLRVPENALRVFRRGMGISARVLWVP